MNPVGGRVIPRLQKIVTMVLMVCTGTATSGLASISVPDRLDTLSVPGFTWAPLQTLDMSGVPIYKKSFSSRDSVVQTAKALSEHSALFQRVLMVNDKVVLSGIQAGWHWLAEIDADATKSKGYVSALRVTNVEVNSRQVPSFAWLPPHSQRQFNYQSNEAGKQVLQQIYSVPLTEQALTAYLRKQLHSSGWVAESNLAGARSGSTWRLNSARLRLYPVQGAAGTSLYVYYAE